MGGRAVNALVAGFLAALLWLGAVLFVSSVVMAALPTARDVLARLRRFFGRSKIHGVIAATAVVGIVMYGGSKGTRSVSFPRTDIEQAYLVDAGSYVTNGLVHVAFNSFLVPQDAPIILARWPDGSTNEADIVTAYAATLAEFPRPLDFYFEAAMSNRWMCYTTWTPGPAVHTNGVWQTNWMTDRLRNEFIIPIRTSVQVDGTVIAPPTRRGEPEGERNE